MKLLKITGVFFMILSFFTLVIGIVTQYNQPAVVEEVPCYDRFSNEIKDEICIAKTMPVFETYFMVGVATLVLGVWSYSVREEE